MHDFTEGKKALPSPVYSFEWVYWGQNLCRLQFVVQDEILFPWQWKVESMINKILWKCALILHCHNQFPITHLSFDILYIISCWNSLYKVSDSSLHINWPVSFLALGNENPMAMWNELHIWDSIRFVCIQICAIHYIQALTDSCCAPTSASELKYGPSKLNKISQQPQWLNELHHHDWKIPNKNYCLFFSWADTLKEIITNKTKTSIYVEPNASLVNTRLDLH